MIGYEVYVGMLLRYLYWSFGKFYEKNKMFYFLNFIGFFYEMVINLDFCLVYLMKDNILLL